MDGQALDVRTPPSRTRGMAISLGIIAAVSAGAAAVAAKSVLVPILLASLLALALAPITHLLERARIPPAIAAVLTVITAAAAIVAISIVAAPRFSALAEQIPSLMEELDRKISPLKTSLAEVGDATETIETMVTDADDASKVQTVKIAGASTAQTFLKLVPGVFAQFFFVVLLAIFILAGRHSYRLKMIAAAKSIPMRLRIARIIRDVGDKVSGYLFVISTINVFVGVAAAGAFYALGLPDPIVWGVAFGIANFVPFVGAAAVMLASALVGLATQETIVAALSGAAVLAAISAIEGNIIQPLLLARRTVVNPLAIFISFALFTWMWGPAATLLAVPIVVSFAVIARHTPGMQPLAILLTNEQPQRGRLAAFMAAARQRNRSGTIRSQSGFSQRALLRQSRRRDYARPTGNQGDPHELGSRRRQLEADDRQNQGTVGQTH